MVTGDELRARRDRFCFLESIRELCLRLLQLLAPDRDEFASAGADVESGQGHTESWDFAPAELRQLQELECFPVRAMDAEEASLEQLVSGCAFACGCGCVRVLCFGE